MLHKNICYQNVKIACYCINSCEKTKIKWDHFVFQFKAYLDNFFGFGHQCNEKYNATIYYKCYKKIQNNNKFEFLIMFRNCPLAYIFSTCGDCGSVYYTVYIVQFTSYTLYPFLKICTQGVIRICSSNWNLSKTDKS